MALDLETFYRDHHRLVRWVARGARVPEAFLDDVVQDVFVSAYHRRHGIPAGEERRWLVNMARGVCFSHRRSAARRRDRDAEYAATTVDETSDLDATLERRRALQRLWNALQQLDDDQRDVFIFVELAGMTAREVASALGISPNTASSRLRLARRKLGALSEDVLDDARRHTEPSRSRTRAVWLTIANAVAPKASVLLGVAAVAAATVTGLGWGAFVAQRPLPQQLRSALSEGAQRRIALPDRELPVPALPRIEEAHAGTSRATPRPSTLRDEARWLARVAGAIERNDLADAQTMLAGYARRFPRGELAPEHARLWEEYRRRDEHFRMTMTKASTGGASGR